MLVKINVAKCPCDIYHNWPQIYLYFNHKQKKRVYWEESGKSSKIIIIKKSCPSPLSGSKWPKLYCVIHELGLTVINYLFDIVIILQSELLPIRHVLSFTRFCILTFVTTAPKGGWMPSPYTALFFGHASLSTTVHKYLNLSSVSRYVGAHGQTTSHGSSERPWRGGSHGGDMGEKKHRNDSVWSMSCVWVTVLCICFSWILFIKEF
jgi:hypothetical protein